MSQIHSSSPILSRVVYGVGISVISSAITSFAV